MIQASQQLQYNNNIFIDHQRTRTANITITTTSKMNDTISHNIRPKHNNYSKQQHQQEQCTKGRRIQYRKTFILYYYCLLHIIIILAVHNTSSVIVVKAHSRSISNGDPIYRVRSVSSSSNTLQRQQQQRQHEWRSYYSQNQHRERYNPRSYRPKSIDYSTKYKDFDSVLHDQRARIFNVDFKRRRPNALSITSRLVWMTILSFGCQIWKPNITTMGYKISEKILRGEQLYRLITPIFLHAGIIHLCTNMISLQRVGNDVEKLFGPNRYLSTYIVAGICGNLVSAYRSPNPSLGASGSVFGIVGAYYVFLNRNEWLLGETGKSITDSIQQTMIANVMLGFVLPQIDQWGHLGGAIGGGIMAYLFGPRLYLSEIPSSNNNNYHDEMSKPIRIIIDRPIVCVPQYIEMIPKRFNQGINHITTWFNVEIVNRLIPSDVQPWQLNSRVRSHYYNRLKDNIIPTQSIKPGPVD